jgi:hypothetical protein
VVDCVVPFEDIDICPTALNPEEHPMFYHVALEAIRSMLIQAFSSADLQTNVSNTVYTTCILCPLVAGSAHMHTYACVCADFLHHLLSGTSDSISRAANIIRDDDMDSVTESDIMDEHRDGSQESHTGTRSQVRFNPSVDVQMIENCDMDAIRSDSDSSVEFIGTTTVTPAKANLSVLQGCVSKKPAVSQLTRRSHSAPRSSKHTSGNIPLTSLTGTQCMHTLAYAYNCYAHSCHVVDVMFDCFVAVCSSFLLYNTKSSLLHFVYLTVTECSSHFTTIAHGVKRRTSTQSRVNVVGQSQGAGASI